MPMRPASASRTAAVLALPAAGLAALVAAPAAYASVPPTAAHLVQATAAHGRITGRASAGEASGRLAAKSAARDLAALVNTLIGTADGGDVFPGADTPFGMLQWSPDTASRPSGGGYSARSTEITGFSLVHMSGPGCKFGGDVPVLPTLGAVRRASDDHYRRSRRSPGREAMPLRGSASAGARTTGTTC